MQRWIAVAMTLTALMTGCTKDGSESSQKVPVSPAIAQAPKELLPSFAAARDCLASCQTLWYTLKTSPEQAFKPNLPLLFSELILAPEEQLRFQQLVEQFPPHLQPLGKLQPDDLDASENQGKFGTYKKEPPNMHGRLFNVVKDGGRTVYIYSGVSYFRSTGTNMGSMQVAIDPEAHETAGMIRSGKDLDEYYIAGARSLRGVLLAFTVADDLETADMLSHYSANKSAAPYVT